jgi:hypothetical protein
MKHYKIGVLAVGLLAMTSCGGEDPAGLPEIDVIDTAASVGTGDIDEVVVFYRVPTPDELFKFIKSASDKPAMHLLNDPGNVDTYVDNKTKALNFGIYSTDLAYSSSFDSQGSDILKYYSCIRKLGEDLNISSAFSGPIVDRIEQNLDQGDSLLSISKETYYNAYDYLEQNDRGPTLALVIAGGWIESIFIVTKLIDGYSADNPTIDRMADQRLPLENLILFLQKYEDQDEGVASAIADLTEIQAIFETLEEVEIAVEATDGGRPALGGTPTKMTFSEDQFKTMSEKVVALRNAITG